MCRIFANFMLCNKSISLKTKPPKGMPRKILMGKLFFVVAAITFFNCTSYCQLRVTLVGGGHTASVKETNTLPGWNEIENKYSSRTGVHAGFIADLQLGP